MKKIKSKRLSQYDYTINLYIGEGCTVGNNCTSGDGCSSGTNCSTGNGCTTV